MQKLNVEASTSQHDAATGPQEAIYVFFSSFAVVFVHLFCFVCFHSKVRLPNSALLTLTNSATLPLNNTWGLNFEFEIIVRRTQATSHIGLLFFTGRKEISPGS